MENHSAKDVENLEKEKLELERKVETALLELAASKEKEAGLTMQLNSVTGRLGEMEEIVQVLTSENERINGLRQQEEVQWNRIISTSRQKLNKTGRELEICRSTLEETNHLRLFTRTKIMALKEEVSELEDQVTDLKRKNFKLHKENEVLSVESAIIKDANANMDEKLRESRLKIHSLRNTETILREKVDSLSQAVTVQMETDTILDLN